DRQAQIYLLSLRKGQRSPFQPADELHPDEAEKKPEPKPEEKKEGESQPPSVTIDLDGIQQRLMLVPVPAGNYSDLSTDGNYFYYRNLHHVDWPAKLAQCRPLADRVTDRGELSDLLAQMVSELSALHIFVYGGDFRKGSEQVLPASLGAEWSRDEANGGYRID